MDIYIINNSTCNNVSDEMLLKYKHKDIHHPEKLNEHCLSYLMLDRILKNVYKVKNSEIKFVDNKPFLYSNEKFFSVSHSRDFIAIAISDCECGLDIEKIVPRDFVRISKRMNFSCANNLMEFYTEWTKYEAVYKLGCAYKSIKQFQIENYMMTAVSVNNSEVFEIYIQN